MSVNSRTLQPLAALSCWVNAQSWRGLGSLWIEGLGALSELGGQRSYSIYGRILFTGLSFDC